MPGYNVFDIYFFEQASNTVIHKISRVDLIPINTGKELIYSYRLEDKDLDILVEKNKNVSVFVTTISSEPRGGNENRDKILYVSNISPFFYNIDNVPLYMTYKLGVIGSIPKDAKVYLNAFPMDGDGYYDEYYDHPFPIAIYSKYGVFKILHRDNGDLDVYYTGYAGGQSQMPKLRIFYFFSDVKPRYYHSLEFGSSANDQW